MNFYTASVALLWTTAMRPGAAAPVRARHLAGGRRQIKVWLLCVLGFS
jgi:hypothetical protein